MPKTLQKGDKGPQVKKLQRLLIKAGYPIDDDGDFGANTRRAVRAFQSQNIDSHGDPLVIDGKVGPLTWASMLKGKAYIEAPGPVNYARMPDPKFGGTKIGRAALSKALAEMRAGAREIGGNNRGKFVRKYLEPAGLQPPNAWCASFVSWCFYRASGSSLDRMPFDYCPGARALLTQMKNKGWAKEPRSDYTPSPGDLVIWWRERLAGWKGHVGIVHHVRDGRLYTIEGNKSPNVQGFSYVLGRMEKILGYGRVR